jgi:hypothetical protein
MEWRLSPDNKEVVSAAAQGVQRSQRKKRRVLNKKGLFIVMDTNV